MKDTISETQLYALKGVRYVAQGYREKLDELENCVAEIIGDEDEYQDWSLEFIHNLDDRSVEEFLSNLKIGVKYDE